MKDLIFETLLAEASFRLAEKTITGIDVDEAIHEVAAEMELDETEIDTLKARNKKAPSVKKSSFPVSEDDEELPVDDMISDIEDDITDQNSIVFGNDEELDTALGVLMYKGIAWNSKAQDRVTFDSSDDVKKAQEALGRRWDFISSEPRVVATIAFDNLADYAKVLDFIASKKMGVIMAKDEDLETDRDLELAEAEAQYKRDRKNSRELGLPSPEEPAQDMSYKALHKDNLVDASALNVLSDPTARALHVVKRWK